jgi:glutamate carboxypeptidase
MDRGHWPDPEVLLDAASGRRTRYLEILEELVAIDSGSTDVDGVQRMGTACQERLAASGWAVERIPLTQGTSGIRTGDALLARRDGASPAGPRILLLAHMDTVFPPGTAAGRPFRMEEGLAHGPGVADMKAGLASGVIASDVLSDLGIEPYRELIFLLTPDEEIGSVASGPLVRDVAATADVGLCLESARENGDIVSARKGVADIRVEVTGRAAHAGVEPERGANAVLEAARKTIALQELNDPTVGETVNVGVIRAGRLRNVIAEEAHLEVDVRAWESGAFEDLQRRVRQIGYETSVPGTTSRAHRLAHYPPMERTEEVARLAARAAMIARRLGFAVADAATGGSSDANTAAAAGLPVLDGLGPIGGDDHGPEEWIDLDSLVPRTALLAGLIAELGVHPDTTGAVSP